MKKLFASLAITALVALPVAAQESGSASGSGGAGGAGGASGGAAGGAAGAGAGVGPCACCWAGEASSFTSVWCLGSALLLSSRCMQYLRMQNFVAAFFCR